MESCRLYQALDVARNLLQGCSCLLQLLKGRSGFITPPEQQTEHLCRSGRKWSLCCQEQPETTIVCCRSAFVRQQVLQNISSKVVPPGHVPNPLPLDPLDPLDPRTHDQQQRCRP